MQALVPRPYSHRGTSMASAWIARRKRSDGKTRYRVMYRVGGRESVPQYYGSFARKKEATTRRDLVRGLLAAGQVPPELKDLLAAPAAAPTFREKAREWQNSRSDVRGSTVVQHTTALNRAYSFLGDKSVDAISIDDVQSMVDALAGEGKARESIRKTRTAVAMVLDFARVRPNPARDKLIRLPHEESEEIEPPTAEQVEAVAQYLTADYLLGMVVLDATGCRIGELAAAKLEDLDEGRCAWLVRSRVSKTKRRRWVELPDDLFRVVLDRLPAREDRDLNAPLFPMPGRNGETDGRADDRLRMAIQRACRHAGIAAWSPHDLRHRRISLLHHAGMSWAEIGAMVGQRNLAVTANTYSHVIMDYSEIDRAKLLERVRVVHTPVQTSGATNGSFAGKF